MLLREPPKSLEVSGKVYKIHTDFRIWLGLQALFQEKALTAAEKALIACRRVYGRNIPEDMNAALDALLWFYGGGLDTPDDEPPGERLLDWEQDAAAIWADFKLYYRRDLRRARMHWWDFLALFTALPEGSVIRGRMSLRAVKLGEIKDPEMRAEYARRKARVRLDGEAPGMDDFYAHMSTLTYNTKPGLASVYTVPASLLDGGHHVSVYPMNWDSQGHETPESLRQVLVNGLALAFIDQSPQPSDSSLTQYGVSKLISPYRTNIRVHIADIQLETENRTPATNAYVTPNAPMVVSWSVKDFSEYFTQKPVQASFEVQYYTQTGSSISDWKTITGTTDATATIPASDLAGVERVTWRVRLTSDDGVVGEWSDWEYCTCVNKSGKATALSPDGASVTAGETVMFLWEHSSTSGLGQAAVQIQMQAPGATAYTDIYTGNTSARRRGIVLPSTISNTAGQAAWRVRTKDTAGTWSEWSDPLYVYIVAAAAAPAVSSVSTGTARPVVAWQSANQTGYQVRVRDTAGNTIYDSGVLPGSEQSHQITDYLPDGDYVVAVTIWNQYAIESAEGTKTFTVSAPVLAAPQIRCGGVRGGVRVRIDAKPSARLLLMRDGVPVLEVSSTESTFYDWAAGTGTHEYKLRAETADSFSESASSWAAPEISCGILSTADEPGRQVHMRISRDASPGHDDDMMLEVTQRAFQGRALPVAEFTGRRTHTHRHTFSLLHPEELKLLLEMVLSEKTLLYRDPFGRRYFCICPSLPISYDKYSNDISLDLEEVDYKEDLT